MGYRRPAPFGVAASANWMHRTAIRQAKKTILYSVYGRRKPTFSMPQIDAMLSGPHRVTWQFQAFECQRRRIAHVRDHAPGTAYLLAVLALAH